MSTLDRPRPPALATRAVKHWRSFGPEEWAHVQEGAWGFFLGSVAPVLLYFLVRQALSFGAAVAAVLTWSALVFALHWRRTSGLDVFSAVTFGFACLQAFIGMLWRNEFLYLAAPSLENAVEGAVLLGSALLGRPIIALYVRRLYPFPPRIETVAVFKRAFLAVSLLWCVLLLLRAGVRLYLLTLWQQGVLPLEWYLVANTVSGWPINITLAAFTFWWPLRALDRAGLMAELPTLGAREVEDALTDAAPSLP